MQLGIEHTNKLGCDAKKLFMVHNAVLTGRMCLVPESWSITV